MKRKAHAVIAHIFALSFVHLTLQHTVGASIDEVLIKTVEATTVVMR